MKRSWSLGVLGAVAASLGALCLSGTSAAAMPSCSGEASLRGKSEVSMTFACTPPGATTFRVESNEPLLTASDPSGAYGCQVQTGLVFQCEVAHPMIPPVSEALFTTQRPACPTGIPLELRVTAIVNFQEPPLRSFWLPNPCRAVPRCTASHLRAWAGTTTGAAGHLLAELAFVNRGHARCSLSGYPRVQMLDAAGRPIRTADEDASPGALGIERRTVVLAPGQRAYFGVHFANKTGFGSLVCPTASRLRLMLPGRRESVVLSGPGARIAPYGGAAGHACGALQVTPVTRTRFQ